MKAFPQAVITILAALNVSPSFAQGPGLGAWIAASDPSSEVGQAPRPSPKDPGTATILSVVIIGAGQMYAGDVGRGLKMLGGAYGAVIAGAILSSGASVDLDTGTLSAGSFAPLIVGALAATGIWIYGIVDAAPTVRRMNAKRGLAATGITPVFRTTTAGERQIGVRLTF